MRKIFSQFYIACMTMMRPWTRLNFCCVLLWESSDYWLDDARSRINDEARSILHHFEQQLDFPRIFLFLLTRISIIIAFVWTSPIFVCAVKEHENLFMFYFKTTFDEKENNFQFSVIVFHSQFDARNNKISIIF